MNSIYYLTRPVTISTLSHLPAITPISSISRISAIEPADEEFTSQLQQNPVINQVLIYQGLKAEQDLKESAVLKRPVQAVSSTSEVQITSQSQSVPWLPVSPEPAPLPLYSKDGQTHNAATNPPQRLSIEV
ncbi:MAG: hypothetical protein CMI12_08900 [Oceanospirillum sp.]|nr:hypothetical protein [Oceanospirillum sp.]